MLPKLAIIAALAAITTQLLRVSWESVVCVEPGDVIPRLEAPRGDGCWVALNATIGAKLSTGYLGACAAQDFDDTIRVKFDAEPLSIRAATPWTLHCATQSSCRWHAKRRGEAQVCSTWLARATHFVGTRVLGKCQLPWGVYIEWYARTPGDAVVTPRGVDHAPCGGVERWRPPDRNREALISAVWNRTLTAFGR